MTPHEEDRELEKLFSEMTVDEIQDHLCFENKELWRDDYGAWCSMVNIACKVIDQKNHVTKG